jgi:uncharacterized protein (UPF0332 family)
MSYIEKARVNREVAEKYFGELGKECVVVSRFYYAAILLVRAYLKKKGMNPNIVDHRGVNSLWAIARRTFTSNTDIYNALRKFESTYRHMRNDADYEDNIVFSMDDVVKLSVDTDTLFNKLKVLL